MRRTKNIIIYIMGGFFLGLIVERDLVPIIIFVAGTLLIVTTIVRFVYRYFLRKNVGTTGRTDWAESIKRYRKKQEEVFAATAFLASMTDSEYIEIEIVGHKKEDADCLITFADGMRKRFKVSAMLAELEKTGVIGEQWLKANGTKVEPITKDV